MNSKVIRGIALMLNHHLAQSRPPAQAYHRPISSQRLVARSCCWRHIVHSSESKRGCMQVQLFLNILQKDLIVGCGKLKFISCKFAMLSCHSKKQLDPDLQGDTRKGWPGWLQTDCANSLLPLQNCQDNDIEKVCHETKMLRHHWVFT